MIRKENLINRIKSKLVNGAEDVDRLREIKFAIYIKYTTKTPQAQTKTKVCIVWYRHFSVEQGRGGGARSESCEIVCEQAKREGGSYLLTWTLKEGSIN